MKRAIAFCLLIVTCFAGTAKATVILENWTPELEGLVRGITGQIEEMPFIRA